VLEPKKNNTEANKWLAQYIENMDASSCYKKGLMYSEDEANRNFDISFIYLKTAAEKHHTKAYAKLGDMYLQGHGVEQSYTEALKYYALYTEKMDQEDLYEFGDDYYHVDGEIFNQKVALVYFQKASEKNHGMSQARLAEMYLLGVEVGQNREKAFELINLSTNNMDKYDLCMTGERYYYGTGVDIDYEIAAIYFKASADQGNDQAEAKLGDMYYYGLGVEKNHDKAMEWHTRSLEGITPADCYSLSKRYTDDGDTQCYQIAFVYIKLAAVGRYPAAQNELGDMYLNGKGVEQDNEKALEWYTNAARSN
jgi:TPR repeat protein